MINQSNEMISTDFAIMNARILFIFRKDAFSKPFETDSLYHSHPKHEFFFIRQGDFTIYIDGIEYLLDTNSFVAVPAGAAHHADRLGEGAQVFCATVQFYEAQKSDDGTAGNFFGSLHGLMSKKVESLIIRDCPKVFEKLNELSDALQNIRNPLYRQYLECTAQQLFIGMICCMGINTCFHNKKQAKALSSLPNVSYAPSGVALNKEGRQFYTQIIDDFIGDLSYEKITLPQLAGRLRIGDRQTSRLIKQIYDISFEELFSRTRVTMAKSMILESDLPIEKIAEQVGYSYVGFLRAFKRLTGKTPTEFRKNVRGKSK